MADNPYAQFVEPNPYAQFVKATPPAAPVTKKDVFKEFRTAREQNPPFGGDVMLNFEGSEDNPAMVNLGAGMKRTLTGLGQMILPKSLEFGPFTDKARAQDAEDRKSLEGTTGSTVGQMVGETLPTLPVGLPNAARNVLVQTLGRGGTAALKAGQVATSKPVTNALEGAVDAAATADPGQAEEAGAMGGGVGAGFSVLGKTGSALRRGLVSKSDAALDLSHLASQNGQDLFQPLAQAAGDQNLTSRLFKSGYRELLPLVPGTSGRLERQADNVTKTIRNMAAEEATPVGMKLTTDAGEAASRTVRELRAEFNKRYLDTVKSYAFNVPPDFRKDLAARIKAAVPNIDDVTLNKVATDADQHMARFSSGNSTIDGANLLEVKNAIGRGWTKAEGVARKPIEIAQKYVDEIIETELKQGNKASNLADLAKYQELDAPYRNFLPFSKAVKAAKAKKGNFSPMQLARASREGADMMDLATTAVEATKDSVTGRTPRWLGYGGIAAAGALDPVSAITTLGAGQMLSTEFVQKALMGDLKAQKAMEEFIKNNPGFAEDLGRLIRNSTTTQIGASYGN